MLMKKAYLVFGIIVLVNMLLSTSVLMWVSSVEAQMKKKDIECGISLDNVGKLEAELLALKNRLAQLNETVRQEAWHNLNFRRAMFDRTNYLLMHSNLPLRIAVYLSAPEFEHCGGDVCWSDPQAYPGHGILELYANGTLLEQIDAYGGPWFAFSKAVLVGTPISVQFHDNPCYLDAALETTVQVPDQYYGLPYEADTIYLTLEWSGACGI